MDRRLRQFLKKGSQLGPREFWVRLTQLFKVIPAEILPNNAADAAELLSALHGGIVNKDESKFNHEAGFGAYLEVVSLINERLSEEDQNKLLEEMVLPLILQYLRPSLETSQWTIPSNATSLLPKALQIKGMSAIISSQWPQLAQRLIDDIRTSAPEQSKDYEKSQSTVIQHATKFAILQEQILKTESSQSLRSTLSDTCSNIISEALGVLKNRNGKPYGAAGTIAVLMHRNRDLIKSGQSEKELETFIEDFAATLILSPSATYLVDILYSLVDSSVFEKAWGSALKTVLQETDSSDKTKALEALLTSSRMPSTFALATSDPELQSYVRSSVRDAVEGSAEWDSFTRMLQSQAQILSPDTTDDVLVYLTQSLSVSQRAPYSIQGLRQIVKSNPSLLRDFLGRSHGSTLLQALLLASESPNDEVAQDATAINASIQTILAAGSDTKQSIYDLIHQGLREATRTSVSVETLVDLAKQSVKPGTDWNDISKVFPSLDTWNDALRPFLNAMPKSSLAITNPLGGGVYLVESGSSSKDIKAMARDVDGYSAAYRMTQYVTRLFKNPELFTMSQLPEEVRAAYLHNAAITIQLAQDNLGLAGANGLWADYSQDVEADAMTFISDAQSLVTEELKRLSVVWSEGDAESTLLAWAVKLLSKDKPETPAQAYYDARTYSVLVADAIEVAGWKASQTAQLQDILKTIRKTKAVFSLLGFLNGFKEPLAASKACERMCNEIVADLTGLDIATSQDEGLRQLILLNTLLSQEDISASIAKQRLVFFVKHVVPWLQADDVARPVKAELCRALIILLPLMSDMYGEHWTDILSSLAAGWAATKNFEEHESWMDRYVTFAYVIRMSAYHTSPIPFVHASLKLYAQLRTLTQAEEPNDDLLDAWKGAEQPVADSLINLLKHAQHFPDEFHQPLKMLNDVLARQIAKVSLQHLEATEELYPLLYVESQPVQQTAFDILHKQIPAAQEQISIDAALEKTTARLPEELLSLIIEAPTVAALAEANFERSVPLQLRGYLLSWLLVFDHLEHSSFKVKNDYVEHVKEGDYLPGLLNFTFDFLGHAHNKPVDVSKLDITTYTPDVEAPKKDLQWLLTHLYFLCLRHVPSLTKSWFISCKSRATVVTLEPWTEKHVSPPLPTPTHPPPNPSSDLPSRHHRRPRLRIHLVRAIRHLRPRLPLQHPRRPARPRDNRLLPRRRPNHVDARFPSARFSPRQRTHRRPQPRRRQRNKMAVLAAHLAWRHHYLQRQFDRCADDV